MRPTAPLTVLAVVSLVPWLFGCDAAAEPVAGRDTVAIGTLPGELLTTSPASTSPASTSPASTTTTTPATTTEPEGADPTDPPDDADVAGSGPPGEPAAATTTSPSGPTRLVDALAGLVEGDVPARVDTATLRDDSGRLRLAVPREWSDHRTTPSRLADGTEVPAVAASSDLTAFLDSYDTPGLTAVVVPEDPADALDAYEFGEDCTAGRRGPYRSPDVEGRYVVWESCGGTLHDIVTVAVRPDGSDESVLLLVQVVGPEDLVALDAAVDSLDLRA